MRDQERIARIREQLRLEELDAVVCALPVHVLLLSGYWPVVGISIAVFTRDSGVILLVPEDEKELTSAGWADEIHVFHPASLSKLVLLEQIVAEHWKELAARLGLSNATIGYESGQVSQPASYVGLNLYGSALLNILQQGSPGARLRGVDEMLAGLMSVKTRAEIDRIREACRTAGKAFTQASAALRPGFKETEAASLFRQKLSVYGENDSCHRADGFVFCMSGPNSAKAAAAYARSRQRRLEDGDLVLVHCNSYLDGYWTDITRTYTLGEPSPRQQQIYHAVFEALQAALDAIQPGVEAASVDRAARSVLRNHGFEKEFKHSTGHGVGFAAISANARPQIHPQSREPLVPGMVFNVEPAVYVDGSGGFRHCEMVRVTDSGYELLTPFQSTPGDLNVLR